ncbi:MAG: hypothetical protein QXV58_15065 [Saccharolobus sp.]|uniref:hypothetical protein n=1 Tax=Saccharolobus sp. TaxID=2100761 RepID=UPI0031622F73
MTVCDGGFEIDPNTGEVVGQCFENTEKEQDRRLIHYSTLPPVPVKPKSVKRFDKGQQIDELVRCVITFTRLSKMLNQQIKQDNGASVSKD